MEDSGAVADHVVVFITVPVGDEARRLADELAHNRWVACVNIVPLVDSIFRWWGGVDSARESLLIVKTKASRLDEVVKLVRQRHSYEVPEIVALPVVGGNPAYLEWLSGEVG